MMHLLARTALRTLIALLLVAPTLRAETTPIQKAVAALEVIHELPDGWTVEIGKTSGENPAPAEAVPDESGSGGKIVIDPDQIAAQLPGIDEDEANLPGVLYIFLLHEWYHAQECEGGSASAGGGGSPPYNTSPRGCGDIQLIPGIAVKHCELICTVLVVEGETGPLCDLYSDLREGFNNGLNPPGSGGASALHEKLDCPGDCPSDIPACECCL